MKINNNLYLNSLNNILTKGKMYRLRKSILETIYFSYDSPKDLKDLIIFLRNDYQFTPVLVIQYLIVLFNLKLKEANILFQENTPLQSRIQNTFKTKVLRKKGAIMRVLLAPYSLDENIELNLYYHKKTQNFSPHEYIGLYSKKSIRAIGKIDNIIHVQEQKGYLEFIKASNTVTSFQKEMIEIAIAKAKNRKWYIDNGYVFFLVKKFHKTNFLKQSKGPLRNARFFNLNDVLEVKELPSTEDIAKICYNRTWE